MKKLVLLAISMLMIASNAAFSLSASCKNCIHSCKSHNDGTAKQCARLCHKNSNVDCQKYPGVKVIQQKHSNK